MIDLVYVTFPGSDKKYAYLTRDPAQIGDFAVVNSPISGRITVPVVDVGSAVSDFPSYMKWVEKIVVQQEAVTSVIMQPPVDWTAPKWCVLHENGAVARGQKWHDTEEGAAEQARMIVADDYRAQRKPHKMVILKAVSVIGIDEPAIVVRGVPETKAKGKKKK